MRTQAEARDPEQQVEQLEERVTKVERIKTSQDEGHMLFFRGGYTELNDPRTGQVLTDLGTSANNDDNGWYVGGGFDFLLSDDVWGLWDGASILAELGLEYKHFGSRSQPTALSVLAKPSPETGNTELTMLTVSASPKIKFTQWGKFQPWIIPAGLDIHVISPPSDPVTVLDIGFQVGAGAEYTIWKALKVGVDGRWHWTDDQTFTDNQFWTVGGYLGVGF
ncbi:porin family protein [Nitrosococcus watsonii]|nr:porin family protein [Nitrosococcus watsonii]